MDFHRSLIGIAAAALFCAAAPAGAAPAVLDAFTQLNAVQPVAGGFLAVGPLRPGEDETRLESAAVRLGPDGAPLGPPLPVPPPEPRYVYANLDGLAALPNGELIAVGWVKTADGNPDAWLLRLDAEGNVIWNLAEESADDRRLYSVIVRSDGLVLAVGRSQASPDAADPSNGLLLAYGPAGEAIDSRVYSARGAHRSGFHDVVESGTGDLYLTGWATVGGSDDIWMARLDGSLAELGSGTFGLDGNEIGWAVGRSGEGVAVAATRRSGGGSAGLLARFEPDRDPRRSLETAVAGDLRALAAIPGGAVAAAGRGPGEEGGGALVLVNANGSAEPVVTGAPAGSVFYAVALDGDGRAALVGQARRPGGGVDGLAAVVTLPRLCAPADLDAAFAGLPLGGELLACAGAGAPAEIGLGAGEADAGVLVTPQVGAVDALLLERGVAVDASLNPGRLAEFVPVPAGGGGLRLSLVADGAYAAFGLRKVALSPQMPAGLDMPGAGSFAAAAIAALGYDRLPLTAWGTAADDVAPGPALSAFQAAHGWPVTGVLGEDADALFMVAAAAREGAALAAERAALAIPADGIAFVPDQYGPDPEALAEFAGGMRDGRIHGSGTFNNGDRFVGLWSDDAAEVTAYTAPRRGVFHLASGCTVTLEAVGDADAEGLGTIPPGLVVIRNHGMMVAAGALVDGEVRGRFFRDWQQACFGASG